MFLDLRLRQSTSITSTHRSGKSTRSSVRTSKKKLAEKRRSPFSSTILRREIQRVPNSTRLRMSLSFKPST